LSQLFINFFLGGGNRPDLHHIHLGTTSPASSTSSATDTISKFFDAVRVAGDLHI
jgi:hypothetical protein